MTWGAKTFIWCIIVSFAYIIIGVFGGSFVSHSHHYANMGHFHTSDEIFTFEKKVIEIIKKYQKD